MCPAGKSSVVGKSESSAGGQSSRGMTKTIDGIVVSNKMQKTVVVAVASRKRHGAYGKFVTRTKRYMAHDEKSECQLGDRVRLSECRPLSRHKRWRLQSVLEKAL